MFTKPIILTNEIRNLLGRSNARSCAYAYVVNCRELIVANSTSVQMPKKRVIGNRFTKYSAGELSVHLIEPKNQNIIKDLSEWLKLDTQTYVIFARTLLAVLNKYKLEDIIIENRIDKIVAILPNEKEEELARLELDFHILTRIGDIINEIRNNYNRLLAEIVDVPYLICDLPKQNNVREYNVDVNLSQFIYQNQSYIPHHTQTIHLPFVDGLTAVSWKQFVDKVACENYTNKLYSWIEYDWSIRWLTVFDDDSVKIYTYRPNLYIMALNSNVSFKDATT